MFRPSGTTPDRQEVVLEKLRSGSDDYKPDDFYEAEELNRETPNAKATLRFGEHPRSNTQKRPMGKLYFLIQERIRKEVIPLELQSGMVPSK